MIIEIYSGCRSDSVHVDGYDLSEELPEAVKAELLKNLEILGFPYTDTSYSLYNHILLDFPYTTYAKFHNWDVCDTCGDVIEEALVEL